MAICVSFLIFGWQNGAEFTVHLRESVEDVAKKCSEIKKSAAEFPKSAAEFSRSAAEFSRSAAVSIRIGGHSPRVSGKNVPFRRKSVRKQVPSLRDVKRLSALPPPLLSSQTAGRTVNPVSPGCQAAFRFATATVIFTDHGTKSYSY